MRKTISLFLAVLVTGSTFAADKSPISSIGISADNSSSAVAAAKERGAATASKDIKRGTLRILYYGKPWSIGKPLVDDATGYRIQEKGSVIHFDIFLERALAKDLQFPA